MSRMTNATTDFSNWDSNNYHVQAELLSGEFISSDTILVAAGAPMLEMYSATLTDPAEGITQNTGLTFPIGVLEQFSLGQSQQLQPIFEIGSSRSYFIPGKNVGSLQLGRTLFSGPSLLKVLYAYYSQGNPNLELNFMHKAVDAFVPVGSSSNFPDPDRKLLDLQAIQKDLVAISNRPGYGDFFINLASDLFKQPLGLAFYAKNSLGQNFGAGYIENALIGSHQMNLNAGANVLVEAINLQFDRIVPINMHVTPYVLANAN